MLFKTIYKVDVRELLLIGSVGITPPGTGKGIHID